MMAKQHNTQKQIEGGKKNEQHNLMQIAKK